MSHYTRIKTQMVDGDLIAQALTDLGYEWERGEVTVRGFGLHRRKAEIKVKLGGLSGEIGFVKSGAAYEIIADWSAVRGIGRAAFQEKVTQRYAYHAAVQKLHAQGFDLVAEEKEPNGQIRLVLRRMA